MKSRYFLILLLFVLIIFLILAIFLIDKSLLNKETGKQQSRYLETTPQVNPDDFIPEISNKYLTFTPGKKFIYEGRTKEGTERTEVYVTNETRKVLGINTVVVWDRVWLNDELIEDTKDWYAQDKDGDVWYFGEDSKEIENGKVISTKGSWEAGINGAKPGIVMKASPQAGDSYRQEYYKGEAEDMAEVVSLGVKIKVRYGSFSDCLQTRDWSPLEPGSNEYKYYCPEVAGLVYEVKVEDGEGVQLIDIEDARK